MGAQLMGPTEPLAAAADEEGTDVGEATSSRLHVVYPARIEVEPEDQESPVRRHGYLRANLADRIVLLYVLSACLAQVADTVTTAIALQRQSLMEDNVLMRSAVTQPALTGALKLAAVLLLCTLAMMRLPSRYARLALLLAFGISVIAPLQNTVQILMAR